MKKLCKIGIHRWSLLVGGYHGEAHKCTRCGKVKVHSSLKA